MYLHPKEKMKLQIFRSYLFSDSSSVCPSNIFDDGVIPLGIKSQQKSNQITKNKTSHS